jgi:hypothetical protein
MSKLRFLSTIFMSGAAVLAPATPGLAQSVDDSASSFLQKPADKTTDEERTLQRGKAAIDGGRWSRGKLTR